MKQYSNLLITNLKEHFTITTDHIICEEMFNIHAIMENHYNKPHIFLPSRTADVYSYEYVLYKELDFLDANKVLDFNRVIEHIEANIEQKNNKDHSFTFISLYIACNNATDDAIKAIKKYKFDKNYKKNGFLSARVCLISNDKFITNNLGKDIIFRLKEKK